MKIRGGKGDGNEVKKEVVNEVENRVRTYIEKKLRIN